MADLFIQAQNRTALLRNLINLNGKKQSPKNSETQFRKIGKDWAE